MDQPANLLATLNDSANASINSPSDSPYFPLAYADLKPVAETQRDLL